MQPRSSRRVRLRIASALAALLVLPLAAVPPASPADAATVAPVEGAASAATPSAPADYAYDGGGQVRGASKSSDGSAPRLSYDDAGNPTQVTRTAAGALTVSSLLPSRAAVGAKVTVSGTGFSATAANNAVKFNGATATVTAATATRLSVTVPAGVTTGTVSVAVGGTTVTSEQKFTVTAAVPAPAITGFSPTTGDIGESVTITGSGFSTEKAENNVSLGGVRARVTAATTTSLTVTVPAAGGSGRVVVVTPGGTATSSSDFLAVPELYKAAHVGFSGALAVDGASTTVSLTTAGRMAVLRFTGTKGQKLSLGITGSNMGDVGLYGYTPFNAPFGRDEFNTPWLVSGLVSGWALPELPSTGTYQIIVRPVSATATGSLTATLSNRLTNTLSLTGAGTTVAFTRPGQIAELSLDTADGQAISYGFSGSTLATGTDVISQIKLPNGLLQRWVKDPAFKRNDRLRTVLPAGSIHLTPGAGKTTLLVGPAGAATGSLTVTASPRLNMGDLGYGTGRALPAARPAQEYRGTLTGTAGQNVALHLTQYNPLYRPNVAVFNPDGTQLFQKVVDPDWTNLPTLPTTGTYIVIVFTAGTGTYNIVPWNRVSAGAASPTGAAITANLVPGQATEISVAATAGQKLSLAFTGTPPDGGWVRGRLINADGKMLVDNNFQSLTVMDLPIDAAGTYTVVLHPLSTTSGTVTATLAQAATANLTVGASATATVARLGQRTRYTVAGTAGQRLAVVNTARTLQYAPNLRVLKPDGSQLYIGLNSDLHTIPALPTTGSYQVIIEPYAESGSVTFRLAETTDAGATTVGGATRTMTVASAGRYPDTSVAVTAGQRLSFGLTDWTFAATSIRFRLTDPSGTVIIDSTVAKTGSINTAGALTTAGTYKVAIIPSDWGTGAATMTVSTQTSVGAYTLNTAKALTFSRIGQATWGTFTGTAGQKLTLTYTNKNTTAYPYLIVRNPDGTYQPGYAGAATINFTLPAAGSYELLISPYSASGSITATLRNQTLAATGDATAATNTPPLSTPIIVGPTGQPAPTVQINKRSTAKTGRGGPAFPPSTGPAAAGETWQPGATALDGQGWTTGRDTPAAAYEPLRAANGSTAVSGRVLTIEDKPLADVTIDIEGRSTRTDASGRFLLDGIRPGHRVLRVDGATASTSQRIFGLHDIGVDLTAGQTTVLPYTIWLSKLDTAHTVKFDTPAKSEVVVKTPAIPGLEVRLPAGSIVRDVHGKAVNELGITAIPVDRAPFPLPKSEVPSYFTVQPGSATIFPSGARVIYPNFTHAKPGDTMNFWHYDPAGKGWFIYGTGTVTKNGKSVTPNKGTEVYQFTGAMLITPGNPPPPDKAPTQGGQEFDADPVDLRTGLLIDQHTDLTVDDVMPLDVTRTYQQSDTGKRAFGIGANFTYGLDLYSTNRFVDCWLIMPDGGRIRFVRTSSGVSFQDAVLIAEPTPTAFSGSTLTWNGDGWDLAMRDGTVYVFGDEAPLQSIRDRYGNTTTITRGEPTDMSNGIRRNSGPITQVTSPNGKWIKFTYDTSSRVTRAEDVLGRAADYTYTADGRLETITDVNRGVTRYSYEGGWFKTITDPRNTVYLTNTYDAQGRVKTQQTPGDASWSFTYGADYTELTDPRGKVRRVIFDTAGFKTSDTAAYGTPSAQTTLITRDPTTHQVKSVEDALHRRTEFTYDSYGNTKTVTEMAGTTNARTTVITRNGPFDQVTEVQDALTHKTSYGYKPDGTLQTVTDAMNRSTAFDIDALGKIKKVTDTAAKPVSYDYALGDLVKITDPLGNVNRVFTDVAGRALYASDALGNTSSATYDAANKVRTATDAIGRTTGFEYDPNGNLHKVTDTRQNTTTYDWYPNDILKSVTDPLLRKTEYSYDKKDNLTTLKTALDKTTEYNYDDLGRPWLVRYGITSATAQESKVEYGYDAGNRTRTITDSAAGITTLTPDDFDRPGTVSDPGGTVAYTYDAADRRRTMDVSGQTQTVYDWNDADQLTSVTRGTQKAAITYDTAGRRDTLTVPAGTTQKYGYDDASRISTIAYKRGDVVLGELSYTQDALGRPFHVGGSYARVALPTGSGPFIYDAADQRAGSTYDLEGNLKIDGENTFTWNARGQLIGTAKPGLAVTYGYDAAGRRAAKTAAGNTSTYRYDGLSAVQQLTGGTVTANLMSGGMDETFSRNGQSLLTDALGSTVTTADPLSTGAEYTYDPFGATTISGDDAGNTTRYTGREDDENGLYQYRSRYYSPERQQFISRDPIGLAGGGTNPYTYVSNQPTTLIDPMGTKPCEANSFTAGTPVLMADGTSKPIEQVRPGDRVRATNPRQTDDSSSQEVAAVIVGSGNKKLVTITTTDGGTVTATRGHPFWIDYDGAADTPAGQWIDAADLRHGHWLKTADGRIVRIVGTHAFGQNTTVYNLTVDTLHTYYVMAGDDSVLTHNCGGDKYDRGGQVRYGGLDDLKRPTGVYTQITADMLDTGQAANGASVTGFPKGQGTILNLGRGHLLANRLGGRRMKNNLVPLTQNPVNTPIMRDGIEQTIYDAVAAGETVQYSVEPIYVGDSLTPRALRISAYGSGSLNIAPFELTNPAGTFGMGDEDW